MTGAIPNLLDRSRPLALFAIAATGVFASASLGAIANAVNGWVSPRYFVTVLGWRGVDDVWRASIAQGVFEGLCFGVFFSLVFASGVGLITRASCRYGFAAAHLLGIIAGALVGWLIGGTAAMGLATLSPEFYRRAFLGVPAEFGPMLKYAWVGGSMRGSTCLSPRAAKPTACRLPWSPQQASFFRAFPFLPWTFLFRPYEQDLRHHNHTRTEVESAGSHTSAHPRSARRLTTRDWLPPNHPLFKDGP